MLSCGPFTYTLRFANAVSVNVLTLGMERDGVHTSVSDRWSLGVHPGLLCKHPTLMTIDCSDATDYCGMHWLTLKCVLLLAFMWLFSFPWKLKSTVMLHLRLFLPHPQSSVTWGNQTLLINPRIQLWGLPITWPTLDKQQGTTNGMTLYTPLQHARDKCLLLRICTGSNSVERWSSVYTVVFFLLCQLST
jgi:hypothetical protein